MLRDCYTISRKHQAAPGRRNRCRKLLNLSDPLRIPRDVWNVHRQNPARVLLHDLAIHLRVMLPTVADQNEGQITVERQHVADQLSLVLLSLAGQRALPRNTPLSQEQDRADRNAVKGENSS